MTFLAPWFLGIAAAAAVPLLIHLLRRRIGLRVEFPAARYLARAERDHSRTLRLRNLLLLVLRVATVVLIALAAARPRAPLAGTGHPPTALAIVLDNSMSTSVVEDGAPLLEQLRRRAREVLAEATGEDRVWLLTADGGARGGSVAALAGDLERVRPFAGAGRVRDAVARALATVQASGLEARQVVVLTDGQRSTWREPVANRDGVPVLVVSADSVPPDNHAVVRADVRPPRWTPSGSIGARVTGGDSLTYRVTLEGRTLARGTASAVDEAIVRAAPPERGWLRGTFEIEPDELPADNVRHFAVWIGPAPGVRVAASAGPFARNAVDVLRAAGRVTTGGTAILLSSAEDAGELPALLFAPADPVRAGAANRVLERLGVPWRLGAARRDAAIARPAGADRVPAVTVSSRHELVPQGALGANAEVLARVGASPWMVAGPGYVLVASPLVPEASGLPVAAGFVPWLTEVLSARLHGDRGSVRFAAPGERVTAPPGAAALELPSGARSPVSGGQFEAPRTPGAYFYIEGARRAGALVVNPEPDESQLDRWPADVLAGQVVSDAGVTVSGSGEWPGVVFASVAGRSLVVPLLVLGIVALVLEGLLAAGVRGQR